MTQPKKNTIIMANKEEERVLPIALRRSQSQEIMMPDDARKNVCLTYVCLVNDLSPLGSRARLNRNQYHIVCNEPEQREQEPIQVERSKAHHNLDLKDVKKSLQDTGNKPTTSEVKDHDDDDSDLDFQNFIGFDNPNVLNLTRMKWLTDGTDGNTSASSPSLSLSSSNSIVSQDSVINTEDQTDRHLSTIMSIDKEHNLFGLWSVAGLGKRPEVASSTLKDRRPVFHQTTIVQVCCDAAECTSGCCQYKSKTDLPCSLKCNSCRSCTTCCDPCGGCGPCGPSPVCGTCQTPPCKFSCVGLVPFKIHDDHEVNEVELTPRSSCVQQLPQVVRECHHRPRCQPPSACFPYLMPCFWPARPSAPCHDPRKCFHVPPCLPPRRPIQPKNPATACPPGGKCTDIRPKFPCGVGRRSVKVSGCINPQCPGKIPGYKDAILSKFSKQLKKC